jgi:hypothetical protein
MRRRRSHRRMVSRVFRPGGRAESSPALQCWGAKLGCCLGVPEGRLSARAGRRSAVPPGLGSASQPREPSVETLGYSRPSLRDEDRGSHSWVAPKKAQELTPEGPGKGDWVCVTPAVTKRKTSPQTAPSPLSAHPPRAAGFTPGPRERPTVTYFGGASWCPHGRGPISAFVLDSSGPIGLNWSRLNGLDTASPLPAVTERPHAGARPGPGLHDATAQQDPGRPPPADR